MAELTAVRRGGRWHLLRQETSRTDPETLSTARATGRAAVWRAARALTVTSSPWSLEYFKACLGEPEIALGLAEMLAAECESRQAGDDSQAHFTLCAPGAYVTTRTALRALSGRGLVVAGSRLQAFIDRAHFIVAALGAGLALIAYLIRFSPRHAAAARCDGAFLAVHGEWSNRTRHVLAQLGSRFSPNAIMLVGRMRASPRKIVRNWSDTLGIELPPVVIPVSTRSAIRAIPQMLGLLGRGLCLSPRQPHLPGLRDHAAIVFRILLGAVMRQWWRDSGCSGGTVVYGHTGTADTTLLEQAQQDTGAKTVHAVHGIATGPNFLGFSDAAVFRCGHDARLYAQLHQYGRCIAPAAPMPQPRRGESGILVLTNYAHPLNPGYIASGVADELRVLRDVAATAVHLGARAEPLLWKPHPVWSELPVESRNQLADEAQSLGYRLAPPDATPGDAAARAHWTLATPSTVCLDLLVEGYLCIVLEWQASHADATTAQFPTRVENAIGLKDMLNQLDTANTYQEYFQTAWSRLAPAQALNIAVVLEGLD